MKKILPFTFLTLLLLINTRAQALMMLEPGTGSEDALQTTLQSADLDRSFADEHSILTGIQGWVTTHTVSMIYLSVLSDNNPDHLNILNESVPENFITPVSVILFNGVAPSAARPDWYGVYDVQWVLNNWAPRQAESNTPQS